jgi:hypothetical protein
MAGGNSFARTNLGLFYRDGRGGLAPGGPDATDGLSVMVLISLQRVCDGGHSSGPVHFYRDGCDWTSGKIAMRSPRTEPSQSSLAT